jgi:hypothetical protein
MKRTKTSDEDRADARAGPKGFESVGTILNRVLAGRPDLARAVGRAQADERRAAHGSPPTLPTQTSAELKERRAHASRP